ncbi:complement component C8 gamma chain [Onychomys torridus]|uniref:complement component C8 gamma chain n=1 Tax=Onychomys torridus TaxID=38674 RepID=UPI00167F3190|nr:complement component C8 gamma chain [Onychomys torridus]
MPSSCQGQVLGWSLARGRGSVSGRQRWTSWAVLPVALGSEWTLTWDSEALHLPVWLPAVPDMTAMLSPGAVLFFILLLTTSSLGQRARKPSGSTSPISTIQAQANFNAQQFAGTWLLVAVGSACRFLQEQGHRAEATTLHTAPQGTAMVVSTFRNLDGICWQVRQLFEGTRVPGRFLLQGTRGPVHVVVAETDYQSFAILYLEKARKLTVKLYARSLPVSDSVLSVFEQRVRGANLTEHQIFFFPKYGFCQTADQFHILNEVRR